ncbi:MAG: S8 family serine peptidase [Candidatus Limnocylindria bacterium]
MHRPIRGSRPSAFLAVLFLLAGLVAPSAAVAQPPPALEQPGTDALARDSWIVSLVAGADAALEAPGLARAAGGRLGHVYRHALSGFQLKGSAAAAEALRRSPRVASVQADGAVHLTETLPFGVKRVDAYRSGSGAFQAGFRGNGARIAVLDTGIDLDHPDLVASIDGALGSNCVNPGLSPNDGYGHGTHVAGTAAAPLNGTGVVGVAPEARLVAVKVFDDAGNSAESIVLCGLDHIVGLNADADPSNDVDVANMSWGEQRAWGDCLTDALHRAICAAHAANIVLVAGAGNSAVNAGSFVPAAFPEVISVSALADFDGDRGGAAGCGFVPELFWTECDDTLAFFSNYGSSVDVMAPGVMVYSTWTGGGYKTSSGTSMATPHVAGVAALMAAADATLTPAEALDVLRRTGECPNGQVAGADGTPGCAGQGTWPDDPDGIPEPLANAVRAAQDVATVPPPPPPPGDPTPPGAPVLNSATGGTSSVSLSWSAPSSDGGSPITGYQVWRGEAAGDEELLTAVGVQSSYVDSSVEAGITYWYQVAAVNAIDSGPRSNELSAALIEPPSAPTLLGAPADGAAALSWTEPGDDGGSPVTGYRVYRRVGAGTETLRATTSAGETFWVDFGLTNGTSYTYRVTALNAAGEGAYSNAVTVVPTPDATAPDAPQALTAAKAKASFAVQLSWSAPASDGGSPIATYFVYRRGPGEAGFTFIGSTSDGTTTTFLDEAVARRTTYTYHVTAWNAYGPSPPSDEVSIKSK